MRGGETRLESSLVGWLDICSFVQVRIINYDRLVHNIIAHMVTIYSYSDSIGALSRLTGIQEYVKLVGGTSTGNCS